MWCKIRTKSATGVKTPSRTLPLLFPTIFRPEMPRVFATIAKVFHWTPGQAAALMHSRLGPGKCAWNYAKPGRTLTVLIGRLGAERTRASDAQRTRAAATGTPASRTLAEMVWDAYEEPDLSALRPCQGQPIRPVKMNAGSGFSAQDNCTTR